MANSRLPPSSTRAATAEGERTALLSAADGSADQDHDQSDFDYGTLVPGQRSSGDITPVNTNGSSTPSRLTRSASLARRHERKQRRTAHFSDFKQRARYYIPVLNWLPHYSVHAFAGDLTSAFTLTSLIVPQAMSYATNLAKLSPQHGLWGAAVPPIVYSLLGTGRQLSVGPEAALSLLVGEAISRFIAEETHAHPDITAGQKLKIALAISTILTFEAGIITFMLGIFRLGFLDAVLSRALLRGFITAVGVEIFILQTIPLCGLESLLASTPNVVTPLDKLFFLVENLENVHFLSLAISAVALFMLISAKMFKAKLVERPKFKFLAYVPEVLLVVILSTLATAVFRFDQMGLHVLGKVSAGQVEVHIPFHQAGGYLRSCLGTAAVIAVLGFLDSIVAAKDCASRYNYSISPNRELVALGAANIAASFVTGTIPGYGSITRSRLAGETGATTQAAALLTGMGVLFVSYFLLRFLFYLPTAILAAIICVVVFSILAEVPHDLKFFFKMHAWIDLGLMTLTFLLTLLVNVEVGILVSIIVSCALCIRESAAVRIKILGRVPGTNYFEPLDDDEGDDGLVPGEEIPGVLIVRIRDVALTFANAGALKERLRRLEVYGKGRHHPSEIPTRGEELSVLVFHFADVEHIDASALQLLSEVIESYTARSVLVYFSHLQTEPKARLAKAGVLTLAGDESHVQPTVHAVLVTLSEDSSISPANF